MFEKTDDHENPYQRKNKIEIKMEINQTIVNLGYMITSMALTSNEDTIFFITENNQLMKANVGLDDTSEESKFDYVIYNFHNTAITGLDICIRKQLLVTCSKDRTVRIWNYATRSLEITHTATEEALSVAFHPSGFHIVVGLLDKIMMMNVLSKALTQFKGFQIKGCREIRFAHGGHLFAAVN